MVTGHIERGPVTESEREHRGLLMAPLISLGEIQPLGIQDYDLAVWFSRPEEPSWPVPKGRACRQGEGELKVRLDIEGLPELTYLRQHLADDSLWTELEAAKGFLAKDLLARQVLLREVITRIERSKDQRGLALPAVPAMKHSDGNEPRVSLYFAFAISRKILTRCLGLVSQAQGAEAFSREKAHLTYLGNYPIISGRQDTIHQKAMDFLVLTQFEWSGLLQTLVAAEAFRKAEEACQIIRGHIARLRLSISFPEGSRCEGCR